MCDSERSCRAWKIKHIHRWHLPSKEEAKSESELSLTREQLTQHGQRGNNNVITKAADVDVLLIA